MTNAYKPGVLRAVLGDGAFIERVPRGPGEGTICGDGEVMADIADSPC